MVTKEKAGQVYLYGKQTLSMAKKNNNNNNNNKNKTHRQRHYITIKGSIHQEDITVVTIYEPKIGATTYMKQN